MTRMPRFLNKNDAHASFLEIKMTRMHRFLNKNDAIYSLLK